MVFDLEQCKGGAGGGGERWYGPMLNVNGGGREGEGERLLGKTIFFPGARKGHLTDAGQNINEVGRRKWL